MSTERADVVIVGAGLAGSAAAWALARRGRSVGLLAAVQPGHRRGMSFGREPVMFHPDGGVIDAERAMAAMRRIAVAHGTQASFGTRVLRVEAGHDGATVHTADRSWHAPAVIVAAGAWLEPLLGAQVPLPPLAVIQTQAVHFAPRGPAPWPVFIRYGEIVVYGLPAGRGGEGPRAIKLGG